MQENPKQESTRFSHKHLQGSEFERCVLPSTVITGQSPNYCANRLQSTVADLQLKNTQTYT
jgi:hypothetical protein